MHCVGGVTNSTVYVDKAGYSLNMNGKMVPTELLVAK